LPVVKAPKQEASVATPAQLSKIKTDDIVFDIGANYGSFTYSILNKNPKINMFPISLLVFKVFSARLIEISVLKML
jgi:tRNA G46 methylase TrmB